MLLSICILALIRQSCIGGLINCSSCTVKNTVWRLYFAGLRIALREHFVEFAVKRHTHAMGVVYST